MNMCAIEWAFGQETIIPRNYAIPDRAQRYWRFGTLVILSIMCTPTSAQLLSERILGNIQIEGSLAPGIVISKRGDNFARHERLGLKERYVTLQGPGQVFDRILPGAVWIDNRLVYFGIQADKQFLIDGENKIVLGGKPTSPRISGRPWPSQDGRHYVAFVSDSRSIEWYLDGIKQVTRFDRLIDTPVESPKNAPIFIAVKNCLSRIVGHPASAKARWDKVRWASANADGSIMFVYGEQAGLPILHRNGTLILGEDIFSFVHSKDGKRWVAVVDRSMEGAPRAVLIENGIDALEMPVDESRQKLYFSGDGSTWIWKITDENYSGATLKQRGKTDRRLVSDPLEYYLSEDGVREAYANRIAETPPRVQFTIDNNPIAALTPDVTHDSFQFGPERAFAFEARDDKSKWIISHLGEGPHFEEVSKVLFLPDGRPVYAATAIGHLERMIIIGPAQIKIPANNLHFQTLRLDGSIIRILGDRGTSIVDFSIAISD